jgi:hypothetical protein
VGCVKIWWRDVASAKKILILHWAAGKARGTRAFINKNNGSERLLLRYCRLRLLSTWSCVAQDEKLKHRVDFAACELSGFHVK